MYRIKPEEVYIPLAAKKAEAFLQLRMENPRGF